MPSQSWISATAAQREELRALARSPDREEADRARAILLSVEGWTGARIAAAFGVRTDSVRRWRWIFGRDGVAGLRARKAPGRAATKAQAAIAVIEQVVTPAIADRPNWTLPRLQEEIERRTGERISKSRLSVVLKKGALLGAGRATP
jgi:transposase